MSYRVYAIDLGKQTPEKTKVIICQFDTRDLTFNSVNCHLIVQNDTKIRKFVDNLLNVAQTNLVKLIVFPGLSIPDGLIGHLTSKAKEYQFYILQLKDMIFCFYSNCH